MEKVSNFTHLFLNALHLVDATPSYKLFLQTSRVRIMRICGNIRWFSF